MLQQKIDCCLLYVSQSNGHDRVAVFVSPPPSVDCPQIASSTTQTSASTEDVDWAVLGVGEDVTAKAASKRPDANKHRQAIFPLSDDETEDADIFRLIPQKRRRQMGSTEQGSSSMPAVIAPPTTATQKTSGGSVKHQTPTPVPVVEKDPVEPAEHVEQARSKRRSFTTLFRASKL